MTDIGSRQINWLPVFDLVAPYLGSPVIPGTPEWQQLTDDHPQKWAALLWAAIWWVIAEDARQDAMAEASKVIAASADWGVVGQPRPPSYIPRARVPAPVSGRLSRCEPR